MPDFVTLVKELLVAEFCYAKEQADALVAKHPNIIIKFLMMNRPNYQACCFALEMVEEETSKGVKQ